jgi:transcriptional regulator with XRE-family HTH domain
MSFIDQHVGARVRLRRLVCGLSVDELARTLGTTAATVHSYEQGKTHIPVVALITLSRTFGVDTSYFFVTVLEVLERLPAQPSPTTH